MEMITERLALVAAIDPDSYSANTYYTDAIDMKYWERVVFVIAVGDMANDATVDFSVVEGTTSTPTTAFATAKAITQMTEESTDQDKQCLVEARAEEMDPANRYIRGKLVVATGACDVCVMALAEGWHKPAYNFDLSSVDQVVA